MRLSLGQLLVLLLSLPGCKAPTPRHGTTGQRLTILSINDFHGQLDPLRLRSNESPPRTIAVGGAEALAATIAEERQQRKTTLLLDVGDFMQGTLLSNQFEGEPVRRFYQTIGIDASTIGNHEFDYGPVGPATVAKGSEDRRGALHAFTRQAGYPILTANIVEASTGKPVKWPGVQPTALIERGGIRIGLIGLTTTDSPTTTLPDNVKDLRFQELAPVVIARARELRARGAQVLVAMAHVGGSCRSRAPESCKGDLFDLLRALPPGTIHAAVAGHSHRCIWTRVNGVLATQACSKGMAVGRIELALSGGKVDLAASRVLPPRPVCAQVFDDGGCEAFLRQGSRKGTLRPNPLLAKHRATVQKVGAALASHRQQVRQREVEVLAHAAQRIPHAYRGSSQLGYLFARMLRAAIPGADVALMNAGGVRGDLPAGPITYAALYSVFPFDNRIATVRVTGDQLRRLLRASLSRPHAGILQAAGLGARVDCRNPAKVSDLTDAKGQPLDPRRSYLVVLSDFMLAGGDGLGAVLSELPASARKIYPERLIREEMKRYLKSLRNPIGSAEQPAIPPGAAHVQIVGSCQGGKRKRRARHLCR